MDDALDLTESDDDLEITKAVRKDLAPEDYMSSEFYPADFKPGLKLTNHIRSRGQRT